MTEHSETRPQPLLRRSRADKVIAGVAGGLAQYFGIDPVLLRIAFVLLAFAGPGVILYIIAWIVMPLEPEGAEPPPPRSPHAANAVRLLIGGILVALGGLALINEFVPWFNKIVWPAVIILIGVAVIAYGARR